MQKVIKAPSDLVWDEPETQRGDVDATGFYMIRPEQFRFLKEYSKDVDMARVAKELDIKPSTLQAWLATEGFKAEIIAIQKVWSTNIRFNAQHASAKHLALMDKIEEAYDEGDLDEKAKFAPSLMRGSDTFMRATNHFTPEIGTKGVQIQINIDLSASKTPEKDVPEAVLVEENE